jgi:hypothetical protein
MAAIDPSRQWYLGVIASRSGKGFHESDVDIAANPVPTARRMPSWRWSGSRQAAEASVTVLIRPLWLK